MARITGRMGCAGPDGGLLRRPGEVRRLDGRRGRRHGPAPAGAADPHRHRRGQPRHHLPGAGRLGARGSRGPRRDRPRQRRRLGDLRRRPGPAHGRPVLAGGGDDRPHRPALGRHLPHRRPPRGLLDVRRRRPGALGGGPPGPRVLRLPRVRLPGAPRPSGDRGAGPERASPLLAAPAAAARDRTGRGARQQRGDRRRGARPGRRHGRLGRHHRPPRRRPGDVDPRGRHLHRGGAQAAGEPGGGQHPRGGHPQHLLDRRGLGGGERPRRRRGRDPLHVPRHARHRLHHAGPDADRASLRALEGDRSAGTLRRLRDGALHGQPGALQPHG